MSRFRILVVCTGNVARSPMAQRLLETYLSHEVDLEVSSAGTWGLEGEPMARHAVAVLREWGIDENGFVARALTPAMVGSADLVLTATREHRAAVLADTPAALRRTFTIREMAALVSSAQLALDRTTAADERARALVAAAAAARGTVRRAGVEDDIADPYRRGLEQYRSCRDDIAMAVRVVADVLAPPPTVVPPTEGDVR